MIYFSTHTFNQNILPSISPYIYSTLLTLQYKIKFLARARLFSNSSKTFLQSAHTCSEAHNTSYSVGIRDACQARQNDQGMTMATHTHHGVKERIRGAVTPLPPSSFIMCTGTTVPFTLNKESQPWRSGVWLPC